MKKQILLLSLNIDNLINFLAAGLITSKDNFPIGNYMPDSLTICPKYIPLYKDKIPSSSSAMIKEYDKNLFECVVKISLKIKDDTYERLINNNVLEIATSIPTSAISEVIFESAKAKEKFEKAIKNSNVIGNQTSAIKLVSTVAAYKKLIEATKEVNEQEQLPVLLSAHEDKAAPQYSNLEDSDFSESQNTSDVINVKFNYSKISAYGAVISLLFSMSKNGLISNELFKSFVTGDRQALARIEVSNDFVRVFEYFHGSNEESQASSTHFSKILELVINNNKSTLLDSLILHLQSPDCADDERVRSFYSRISNQILGIYQSSETRSTSVLVNELKQKFEKTSIELYFSFFAIKSDIETLLNTQVDGLREQDYLMLAVFYGMRDGYERLPKFIREYEGLEAYSSYKMASYANAQSEVNFELDEIKTPPTLLDLLDGNKLTIEAKQTLYSKLGAVESASIELASKDFNYINGAINIPLSAKPKLTIKRDEENFTKVMLGITPENFKYKEFIKLAKK